MNKKVLYLVVFVSIMIFVSQKSYSADGFEYLPDTNTLALWHLNEGNGDKIIDASSNKFDGVVEGTSKWGNEEWKKDQTKGSSFAFDGSTLLNMGKVKALVAPDAITVEAWVFADDLAGWKLICCNWGGLVLKTLFQDSI